MNKYLTIKIDTSHTTQFLGADDIPVPVMLQDSLKMSITVNGDPCRGLVVCIGFTGTRWPYAELDEQERRSLVAHIAKLLGEVEHIQTMRTLIENGLTGWSHQDLEAAAALYRQWNPRVDPPGDTE